LFKRFRSAFIWIVKKFACTKEGKVRTLLEMKVGEFEMI